MRKTCCNLDCNQGKNCPLRQGNGGESVDDGLPVVMFEKPYQYAKYLFFGAIRLLMPAVVSLTSAGCVFFILMHFFN